MNDGSQFEENQSDVFQTVYGDMITFVAVLFMVLFMLVFNETKDKTFFAKMNIMFGGEKIEQQDEASTKGLFVKSLEEYTLDEDISQYATIIVQQTRVKLVVNDPILFEAGSAELMPQSVPVLYGFLETLSKFKNPIIIEGFADQSEVGLNNKELWVLSTRRAEAVVDFLVENGISPKRLSIQSFGPYQPTESGSSEMNRRVELTIIRVQGAEESRF